MAFDSSDLNIEEENIKQIVKDLNRTYPEKRVFRMIENQQKMKDVLKAFSNYDREISISF